METEKQEEAISKFENCTYVGNKRFTFCTCGRPLLQLSAKFPEI